MELGLIADATYAQSASWTGPERAAEWVRGAPAKSFWVGSFKSDGPDRLQIATLRCVKCGFLELYAPSP
jgi:hypothetical protein